MKREASKMETGTGLGGRIQGTQNNLPLAQKLSALPLDIGN
jgi:hypothetical protein